MFLGREQPCFLNFYSNIPVDVVRVKFYLNRLFHPATVPMRVSIVLKRVVSGVVRVFGNGGGLGKGKSDVSLMLFGLPVSLM